MALSPEEEYDAGIGGIDNRNLFAASIQSRFL
jgi:hypothetical protein